MHVDLIEFLRCVQPHEPTWLVASVDRIKERDILFGRLGCPVCSTEYPIRDGIGDFRRCGELPEPAMREGVSRDLASAVGTGDLALRAAALLDLTTPGGFVLLAGSWSVAAFELVAMLDGVHALVLNPEPLIASGFGVSILLSDDRIPIRVGSCRGAALDATHSTVGWMTETVSVIRPEGRLIAQADAPIPSDVTIVARDGRDWVAETARATASVVQIARGRPTAS